MTIKEQNAWEHPFYCKSFHLFQMAVLPKCHHWTWCWNMWLLGSYTVCRKWLTVKVQRTANRINIPPWDLTPPGRTAPLPLFTDWLQPRHSTHCHHMRHWPPSWCVCVCLHVSVCMCGEKEGWCVYVPLGCMMIQTVVTLWLCCPDVLLICEAHINADFPAWRSHRCTAGAPRGQTVVVEAIFCWCTGGEE